MALPASGQFPFLELIPPVPRIMGRAEAEAEAAAIAAAGETPEGWTVSCVDG